jgi:hypothetical protein
MTESLPSLVDDPETERILIRAPRGVLWVAYGEAAIKEAVASCLTYRNHNATPTCLLTDDSCDTSWGLDVFDYVWEPDWPCDGHHRKAYADRWSPFDTTLMLDTDTTVMGDLTFGFESAERHGLAVAIAPASQAAHHYGLAGVPADIVEYNTGVLFWSGASQVARRVFDGWRAYRHVVDGLDQPGFAIAVHRTGANPFVLPREWNYRAGIDGPRWFGPLKVWHSRMTPPTFDNQTGAFMELR